MNGIAKATVPDYVGYITLKPTLDFLIVQLDSLNGNRGYQYLLNWWKNDNVISSQTSVRDKTVIRYRGADSLTLTDRLNASQCFCAFQSKSKVISASRKLESQAMSVLSDISGQQHDLTVLKHVLASLSVAKVKDTTGNYMSNMARLFDWDQIWFQLVILELYQSYILRVLAFLRPYSRDNNGLKVVFNTQDEILHKKIKSPIAPLYSLTNTVTFEPLVDEVLACLGEQLNKKFSGTNETFNFGDYLQFFAFDVMGTLTFSKRYGFLETGKDVQGILAAIWSHWKGSAAVSLTISRLVRAFRKTGGMAIIGYINSVLSERIREKSIDALSEGKASSTIAISKTRHVDFLDHFLTAKEDNPDLPAWAPMAWMFSNVLAGSDSTATVIRTVMCSILGGELRKALFRDTVIFSSAVQTNDQIDHLLCNPDTLDKLYQELSDAGVSMPYPRWSEVCNLPYLDACVQEGIRLHPPFSFHFERVVPRGGIEVLGKYLPEGTVVGGNPWVTNRHEGTFGRNPDAWDPERWLAGGDVHRRELEKMLLTFGAGRRVCLGKHIGILELKKVVPFLVLNYKMQVVDPEAFRAENALFFRQEGFFAKLERRT
ncbi:hypothetical protein FHL15_003341 [Xylaria flabelliformis]|uniref:Uncharacterized protein n=1 Tax=Xylaria flabelliformis TaxID=2512241 RepID=A0A553I6G7_9PEZI|nr:hypothetical protein FHL15_003341 [Xylaria flabelliformis]